jgi:hypothetical protein
MKVCNVTKEKVPCGTEMLCQGPSNPCLLGGDGSPSLAAAVGLISKPQTGLSM